MKMDDEQRRAHLNQYILALVRALERMSDTAPEKMPALMDRIEWLLEQAQERDPNDAAPEYDSWFRFFPQQHDKEHRDD